MASNDGFRLKLALFVAGLVTIELLIILMLASSSAVADYNAAERRAVAAEVGSDTEAAITRYAKLAFDYTMVKPGFYEAFNKYLFRYAKRDYVKDNPGSQYAQNRVGTFWRILYAIYYRLASILIWLPYLTPFIVATGVDALQARQVRRWRFSYVSPLVRAWAGRTRFGITCVLIIAILLPTHVPTMIYPVSLLMILATSWITMTHLQKHI